MSADDIDSGAIQPKQTRRIIESDIGEIARLVSVRCLTETEACLLVGLKPVNWFNWKLKQRNNLKFNELFTRMRGAKIESALKRIDDCGDGIGLKQPDWRAKAFMLQAMDRKRFGNDPAGVTVNVDKVVDIAGMRRAFDTPPRALLGFDRALEVETVSGQPETVSTRIKGVKVPPRPRTMPQ